MVPVAVDGLVVGLDDGLDLVAGVELVVEAVLAGQDWRRTKRPKNKAQSQLIGQNLTNLGPERLILIRNSHRWLLGTVMVLSMASLSSK